MDEIINKNVQKIQDVLYGYGIATKIMQFDVSTRTAQDAANAVGCTIGQIAKSLIFCTQQTHKAILVLTSGANRVNETVIEELVGEKIKKADADFVRIVTGFAIGGVPPFGHVQKMITFIDEDLLQYEDIWAAAGTPHSVFCLSPQELIKTTQGVVARIQ